MSGGPITARPFDFPYDGRLDPARLALLVIDLQIDFVSADGYLARRGYDVTAVRAILPAVRSVIEAVRAVGGLVVYTRQGYRADLADMTPLRALAPPSAAGSRERACWCGARRVSRSCRSCRCCPAT